MMVDTSLGGCGSWFGPMGSVGAELDYLLGAAAWHGADELAGEEDLEHGWVEPHGDDLAGQVPAGWDLLAPTPMRPLADTRRVVSVGPTVMGWRAGAPGPGWRASVESA